MNPGLGSIGVAPPLRRPTVAAVAVAVGCAALAARPWLVSREQQEVALLAFLGLVGILWPVAQEPLPAPRVRATAFTVGVTAFALGRLVGGGAPPLAHRPHILVVLALAAVAEEAFFRRFVFGALAHRGAAVAVIGSAVAFAIVHLTVYGGWAMPLDIAAGALLSWQRWVSGSWRVPAATHVLANLMVIW